jgi:hypothetical protein
MTLLGKLLKSSFSITSAATKIRKKNPIKLQKKEFQKLLGKARYTEFGAKYNFEEILNISFFGKNKEFYEAFKKNVPIYDYEKIYKEWWFKSRRGDKNVTWPGQVKFFALSSGTSDAASKAIPVTKAMVKAIQKTSVRQIISLGKYTDIPSDTYETGYLMLGGSTDLKLIDNHYEGDLSGITTGHIPFWFKNFFKPGEKIASEKNWTAKLDQIVEQAPNWDIGFMAGVPAWMQLVMEKIIAKYNLNNIHDMWPNLTIFAWGGVAFEPYKQGFEKLLGKPMHFVETYMASEGFLAAQFEPHSDMELVTNNGVFFEFIPFNDDNFDSDGKVVENPETLMLDEVEENVDYALLISTCSGTWRYLIGDTVKFTNKEKANIKITGRTKHFLSLCGEHLSVDNMNGAIEAAAEHFNIIIKEFTVTGIKHDTLFAHHWYIGTSDKIDNEVLKTFIDNKLCELNDDYPVERKHALKEIFLTILEPEVFLDWMHSLGKEGGQHKFPRVLKGSNLEDWTTFLKKEKHI